jgi:primosomal protein N' (replication factor Y)
MGTEQVERIVNETFPGVRVARMDVDTTSGKWSHQEILGRVERGEVDILLGTQMISKGLDFPRVTLVGVINADVGMHLPDFRSSEKTFQLLSQVAGRAGRGSLGGEVFIQTFLPEHYVLQAALKHDYVGFAQKEILLRQDPTYPPIVRLINVVMSSPDKLCAADNIERATRFLDVAKNRMSIGSEVDVVGPAPCPIEKIQDRWRWHFLIRSASVSALNQLVGPLTKEFKTKGRDVRLIVDRDPSSLL